MAAELDEPEAPAVFPAGGPQVPGVTLQPRDGIPDEAAELDEPEAPAELAADEPQAPDLTLQPRDGIPDEAAEPVELPASDQAPALDEPPAASGEPPAASGEPPAASVELEAHWAEPEAEQDGLRVRAGFPVAGEVWIGPQSPEPTVSRDVVLVYSQEFPDGRPELQDAAVQARAVPRLLRQRQVDAPPVPCKKLAAGGWPRAPLVVHGLPQRIARDWTKLHGPAESGPAPEPFAGRASQPTLERWAVPLFHHSRCCN